MRKNKILLALLMGSVSFLFHEKSYASDPNGDVSILQDMAKFNQAKPEFLQHLIDAGDKVYYIGAYENYRSYVAESNTGKMITVNLMADNPSGSNAIIGEIVTANGECITCEQYMKLNDRIRAMMSKGTMSSSSQTSDPAVAAKTNLKSSSSASLVPGASLTKPLSLSDIRKEQEKEEQGLNDIYLAHSSWSDFSKEADSAGYFDVGSESAPLLYMIADPHCPYCHKYWSKLKPWVESNKLRVRIILADILPGSGPDVHNLLGNPNVGQAWLRGEGSVEGYPITPTVIPGSQPYQDADKAADYNQKFATKYLAAEAPPGNSSGGTPFFGYKGTDGRFYAAEGPGDLEAFLSNIGMK